MSIEQDIKHRKIDNPLEKFKRELEDSENGSFLSSIFKSRKFKPEVAALGLELLRKNGDYDGEITLGSAQAGKFSQLLIPNIWENEHYYALLVYFFGSEKADYVKQAWNVMPVKMYQTGYDRRSFRAPNNPRFVN